MAAGRDKVVTIKVSEDELEMIKRGAESENMSQSDYCRACIYRDRLPEGDPVAIQKTKDNIRSFLKTSEESVQKFLDEMLEPIRRMKETIGGTKIK